MTDLFSFTYIYGNGDSYSGYGFTDTGTYYAGQLLGYGNSDYNNQTGYDGYYYISGVASSSNGTADFVYVNAYYDADSGYGNAYLASGSTTSGLGSESGYAYNSSYSNNKSRFSNYYEADLYTDLYYFTYIYGNGDSYSGYGYTDTGTYYAGQLLGYGNSSYNSQTGTDGYYYISAVASSSSGTADFVYVNAYYDADSGYGNAYLASGNTTSGLGSESGYAHNSSYSNNKSRFSNYYEADLYTDLYYFTYAYGNGDSYSGYGFADTGTYYAGQLLGYGDSGYNNETGYDGYYYISAVASSSSGTADFVYVNAYYDADSGYGNAYLASGSTSYGLGSESGYAYNYIYSNTNSYFSDYSEADLYPL